uniref:Transmembrane protein n=1 Tax=Heterorhabditis bacteriophora TaxID=37862 RepID=A0A1I7WZP5_HETBA
METIRRFGNKAYEFWRSVIEWRSPVTAPYLMFMNILFWMAALYFDETIQLRVLLSMPIAVFSWDILLSPSYNRNIITHVVLWPIQSFWRHHELRSACLTAYTTVGCLLINPVWMYYKVNKKIVNGTSYCVQKITEGAKVSVNKGKQNLIVEGYLKHISHEVFICKNLNLTFRNLNSVMYIIKMVGVSIYTVSGNFSFPSNRYYFFKGTWMVAQIQKLGLFLHKTFFVPTKNYLHACFEELCIWMRQFLHGLAVSIRDSILWPICVLVVDVCKQITFVLYSILLQPILEYLYQRYQIIETTVLIYFLGPLCNTIVNNIPEKSPFCGMLPDELTKVQCSDDEDSERSNSINDLIPCSPLEDIEQDFASGLVFPTIHASESSDEEFDLEQRGRRVNFVRQKKRGEVLELKRAEVDDENSRKCRKSKTTTDVVRSVVIIMLKKAFVTLLRPVCSVYCNASSQFPVCKLGYRSLHSTFIFQSKEKIKENGDFERLLIQTRKTVPRKRRPVTAGLVKNSREPSVVSIVLSESLDLQGITQDVTVNNLYNVTYIDEEFDNALLLVKRLEYTIDPTELSEVFVFQDGAVVCWNIDSAQV